MNTLDFVFRAVLDTSWRGSWLIILLLGLRACFRSHLAARVIFAAWIIVALRLLMPLSFPATWSPFHVTKVGASSVQRSATVSSAAGVSTAVVPAVSRSAEIRLDGFSLLGNLPWAALVWGAGVAALLLLRVGALISFERRLRGAHPEAQEMPGQLDTGGIPILVTDAVSAPALHGIFRPRILIPPGWGAVLKPEELRLTIAHELAHARRRDLLAEAVMHLAVTLHWFNPLAWLAARQARRDCELACDERVLHGAEDGVRQRYGSTLLQVARMISAAPPTFTLGVVGSRRQVRERIETIVANRPFRWWSTISGVAVCAVLTVVSFSSRSAAQPQPATGTPEVTVTAPAGWRKNGMNPEKYVVGVDSRQTRASGVPSAYVRSIREAKGSFGGMMQTISAENYLGKRLRLHAWVKTEDANDGGGHLWFRVDGQERGEVLQFDNMDNRPVVGTADWQEASIVLDVPSTARALAFGFFVAGNGQVWVTGLTLTEVTPDIPSTDMHIPPRRRPN